MVRATIDGIPARNNSRAKKAQAQNSTQSSGRIRITEREEENRRLEAARRQALLDERQRVRARRAAAARRRAQSSSASRPTRVVSKSPVQKSRRVPIPPQKPQNKAPVRHPTRSSHSQEKLDQARRQALLAERESARQSAAEEFLQPVESLGAAVRRKVAERSASDRENLIPEDTPDITQKKTHARKKSLGEASLLALSENDDISPDSTDKPEPKEDDYDYLNPLERKYDDDFWNAFRPAEKDEPPKSATEFGTSRGRIEIGVPDSDPDKKPKKSRPEKPKKHKKKISKQKIIFFSLLGIFILATSATLLWGQGLIAKITSGRATIFDALGAAFSQDVQLKTGKNNRTNVLVFGTSGYEMAGSGHDGAQLTDSIMLLSFDQKTKDLAMLNIPRDFYVGKTCTDTGKINEIYWCANREDNNESAGASALMSSIETTTGIDSQYYVHVDWGALVQLVDSLGGITVTLDEDIADPMTNTYINAGVATTLNGEQALGLARARHGTESGDFSRGNSQQKILVALQQRLAAGDITLTQGINLVNTLGDNLRTDFSANELSTIFHLATEMDLSSMRSVPLIDVNGVYYVNTTNMNVGGVDISYVVPSAGINNYSEIKKYVTRQFSSEASVREEAKILILNGAGVSGLAASERDALVSTGFTVSNIDDAPDGVYPDRYYLYDISGEKPGTISALSKRYGVSALSAEVLPDGINAMNYDIVIILGTQPESLETPAEAQYAQ